MNEISRKLQTEKDRQFWKTAEEAAAEVGQWPDWKRAGVNIAAARAEPVAEPPESDPPTEQQPDADRG